MLSRRKIKAHLVESIREHLGTLMDRGMSLKDDTDGVALYVESLRVEGFTLLFAIEVHDGENPPVVHELALSLQRRKPGAALVSDIQLIDGETS